ncbi:MAG: aminoacyl-tRNA hydrolase [Cytophagales bacterium]|nr:MAG: aminoacyl-tRNA hydrolase [Cytophagales bacterium]TAF61687.1 MAG: aminoacyl-tRNA hydrolase [Cytophagales bacterium]
MKFLIIGLGNIGEEYHETRHNIGFMVLDHLAQKESLRFEPDRLASVCELKHKGKHITLIKPSTFMNLSGKAMRYWMQQLNVDASQCLVLVDDLALAFGVLRLRQSGSDAGHNGLKNIQELLGNNVYPRLRIGIGNNYAKGQQVDYVLSKFSKDEQTAIPELVDKAAQAVLSFCTIGAERTMGLFNK